MGVTTGKSAFQPNIVTNGLVLNLDAINPNSYPQSGTIWYDTSGNNNNGTLTNGTSWTPNGAQTSFSFDGVDDYVVNNTLTSLITSQLTLSVWFFATDVSTDNFIISSENSTTNNSRFVLFQDKVAFISGRINTYSFIPGNNNITGSIRMDFASNSEVLNQWVNITCTFIANNSTGIRGYKNGIEDPNSPVNASTVDPLSNNEPLYIGARNPITDQRFFDGRIGTVQIYNRALTAQEVLQNYNALKSRFGLT
jgi:hypothetical protein